MKRQNIALILFWTGLIVAVAFAGVIGRNFYHNLRTLNADELANTIWATGKPIFIFWAFSITLGSLLAGIGAFLYVKTKPVFIWLTPPGVLAAVLVMNFIWNRIYNPTLFGIGGMVILVSFFVIIWIWMKKYAQLNKGEKVAGSYKLIGYLFWINASWFLCGETGKMHLKAFEGIPQPTPIEIMAFLVLGWLFFMVGEYKELQLRCLPL